MSFKSLRSSLILPDKTDLRHGITPSTVLRSSVLCLWGVFSFRRVWGSSIDQNKSVYIMAKVHPFYLQIIYSLRSDPEKQNKVLFTELRYYVPSSMVCLMDTRSPITSTPAPSPTLQTKSGNHNSLSQYFGGLH